jgi:hypothetical protein
MNTGQQQKHLGSFIPTRSALPKPGKRRDMKMVQPGGAHECQHCKGTQVLLSLNFHSSPGGVDIVCIHVGDSEQLRIIPRRDNFIPTFFYYSSVHNSQTVETDKVPKHR